LRRPQVAAYARFVRPQRHVNRSRPGLSLLPVLALSACGRAVPISPPAALIGVWRNTRSFGQESCLEATIEFRKDSTLLVRNGAAVVTATYTVSQQGNRLVVVQDDVRTNGEPNCQGIPSQYVLDHQLSRGYFEIVGDTLRLYRKYRDSTPAFEATRPQSESANRILAAYYAGTISADSAVAALARVVSQIHGSFSMEVDSSLRVALLRRMQALAESASGAIH